MKSSFAIKLPMRDCSRTFVVSILVLLACSCKEPGPVTSPGTDEEKTLKSLTKANDHPFYTMKFYGDYGFARRVGLSKREPIAGVVSRISFENIVPVDFLSGTECSDYDFLKSRKRAKHTPLNPLSPALSPSHRGDCRSSGKNDWNSTSRTKRPFLCERTWVERREQRDVCFVREDLSQYLRPAQNTTLPFSGGTTARRSTRSDSAWGCTCFAAYGNPADPQFGRNFDWHDCIPLLLFTNPPNGYASVSIVDLEYLGYNRTNLPDGGGNKTALLQTPLYPFDGMNEKGVTVGMMAVPAAQAPYDPKKISLGELGTIRLILDFAASTDEAIALLGQYNHRVEDPPVHYLVADAGGHSAVIEYVNGTMSVLKNSEPWHVSTNFIITGSGAPATSPCWRYNTAYSDLKAANGVLTSDGAMSLLGKVSQTSTIWSIVYGMHSGMVLVATTMDYGGALSFSLTENIPPR